MIVRIVSWTFVLLFALLNFPLRKIKVSLPLNRVIKSICPLLTLYLFLIIYFGGIESEKNDPTALFSVGMIGTAAVYFILVMFNEAWLFNLCFFAPCLGMTLKGVSDWTGDIDIFWLAVIGLFQVFVYGIIGFHTEKL